MKTLGEDVVSIYLHPGEVHIAEGPAVVNTVLGSCVSLTLFHKKSRVGAICHAVHPRCREEEGCDKPCVNSNRYVECAIRYMVDWYRSIGVRPRDLEAKLFGGADVLVSKQEGTIGSQNVKVALDIIRSYKMHVKAADVGDSFGRRLIYHTHTGDVFVRRFLNGTKNNGKNGNGKNGHQRGHP